MSFKFKINKEAIPYRTSLSIAGKNYIFDFKYNSYDGRIYVDLYNSSGNVIYYSEPIIFGMPLWYNKIVDEQGNFKEEFPQAYIIPMSNDKSYKKIDYSNIDNIVMLVKEF